MSWILPSARKRPEHLGLSDGKLLPCPPSPNCVCSQSIIETHYVEPLWYAGSRAEAHRSLVTLLKEDKKASLITDETNYLHIEYRAFIFIDDVEFFFPKDEPIIHVRSASRIGHSDMGANKRRIKAIAAAFSLRQ